MLEVKTINGLIRVVYRHNGNLATNIVFDTCADAWAYIDKIEQDFISGQIA